MSLEDEFILKGLWPVCGVDEAGRGPLAGPVVAAAVIMQPASPLRGIVKDSKVLSASKRENIYKMLTSSDDVSISFSIVKEDVIDEMNILQATLLAMKTAVSNLKLKPIMALVDGDKAPRLECECITVVGGDAKEASISAASIIAKVIRDRYMIDMDRLYPDYGFAVHKGYPTKAHYEAIGNIGISPIHRKSFRCS